MFLITGTIDKGITLFAGTRWLVSIEMQRMH